MAAASGDFASATVADRLAKARHVKEIRVTGTGEWELQNSRWLFILIYPECGWPPARLRMGQLGANPGKSGSGGKDRVRNWDIYDEILSQGHDARRFASETY